MVSHRVFLESRPCLSREIQMSAIGDRPRVRFSPSLGREGTKDKEHLWGDRIKKINSGSQKAQKRNSEVSGVEESCCCCSSTPTCPKPLRDRSQHTLPHTSMCKPTWLCVWLRVTEGEFQAAAVTASAQGLAFCMLNI